MGVTAAVKGLMKDTLRVEPYNLGAISVEGNPAYASSYFVSGRVVHKLTLARDREGREVVSKSHAYVDEGTRTIKEQDRITLPDGTQPSILSIQRTPDSSGDDSVTLFFE
jgi:hypothetical protein